MLAAAAGLGVADDPGPAVADRYGAITRKRRQAVALGDKEALLALCKEVSGEAWETEGLRAIGRAQFKLGDHPPSVALSSGCVASGSRVSFGFSVSPGVASRCGWSRNRTAQ